MGLSVHQISRHALCEAIRGAYWPPWYRGRAPLPCASNRVAACGATVAVAAVRTGREAR